MSEFDQFGHTYKRQLEGTLKGLGSLDSALRSKLQVIRHVLNSRQAGNVGRILDFGCGTGLLSTVLEQFSMNITGVDVSLESLRNTGDCTGRQVLYDGNTLPFKQNAFDLVVASCVFHHISQPSRSAVLRDIMRVLSPDGLLIVIEHNPFNLVTRWVVNRCEFDRNAELISMSGMTNLLRNSGYERHMQGYFYTLPPVNKPLAFIDSCFSAIPLGAQYYCSYRKQPGTG